MASRNLEALRRLVGTGEITDRDTTSAEERMAELFHPDVEVHEPGCMPHGGVHRGRDTWFAVRREMLAARAASPWEQRIEVLHMWDIPEDDVVVMHYRATWTDSRTGQTFEQPGVELLTFDDARIVRTEFFPHDSHALLQTLE